MEAKDFIPYNAKQFSEEERQQRISDFYTYYDTRRSVREYSTKPIPKAWIDDLIMMASSAPSGAHKQPWTFCAVSNPELKSKIREAAEKEEYENYHGRMSEDWLKDLEKFDTNWKKPFLEDAPWLIIVFRKSYDIIDGVKHKNYYVQESVGIACGFLLAAIHQAGLVSLTHTPSPMGFLQELLGRPANEKPYLLIPVGYPKDGVEVPKLTRKSLDEVAVYYQ